MTFSDGSLSACAADVMKRQNCAALRAANQREREEIACCFVGDSFVDSSDPAVK